MTNEIVAIAISILIHVESDGLSGKVGDHGHAVGLLQIHPCIIRDVNRRHNTHFTLSDRTDPWASVAIAKLYLDDVSKRHPGISVTSLCYHWNKPRTGNPRKSYRDRVKKVARIVLTQKQDV